MLIEKYFVNINGMSFVYFIVIKFNDKIKSIETIISNETKNVFLPAMAARCVTDAARLAVLRRRKSDSEDCCTKCRPGPII